jgi:hypothetical protein
MLLTALSLLAQQQNKRHAKTMTRTLPKSCIGLIKILSLDSEFLSAADWKEYVQNKNI